MMKQLVLTGLLICLGGCSTIFQGSSQNINVSAINVDSNKPLKGARCSISDEMGMVYMVPENPGHIKIKKGQGILRFDCKKYGYLQKNTDVHESFDPTAFFNLFFWPGFFVDAVTGAMLEYPGDVVIRMEEDS